MPLRIEDGEKPCLSGSPMSCPSSNDSGTLERFKTHGSEQIPTIETTQHPGSDNHLIAW